MRCIWEEQVVGSSTASSFQTAERISLFDADAGLGAQLLGPAGRHTADAFRVATIRMEHGERLERELDRSSMGLLLIDGVLLRSLTVRGRHGTELLGPGDLVRPWIDPSGPEATIPAASFMRASGEVRLAILDRRVTALIARYPALSMELLDRMVLRTRLLQFQLALTQVPGIAGRLYLLMWQLADRWGFVRPEGIVLPFALTHEALGRLVGARRPSVTMALRELGQDDSVLRTPSGWLLRGEPHRYDALAPAGAA